MRKQTHNFSCVVERCAKPGCWCGIYTARVRNVSGSVCTAHGLERFDAIAEAIKLAGWIRGPFFKTV